MAAEQTEGATGLALLGTETPEALRGLVQAAEDTGASTLWIASHLFRREPIALAAVALAATRRLGVVLMAMSPYVMHPVYATMAAATLEEQFPGRVRLCFGVGAPRDLAAAGIAAPHPLSVLGETIEIARALLSGETIAFRGERFQVSGRRLDHGLRQIPIILAAAGPRMLELAGRVADGVLISAASSAEFVAWSLAQVRRGEAAGGRHVRAIGLVQAAVGENPRAANDELRRTLGFVLRGAHHARNLALAGTELDQAALAAAFAREDWAEVDKMVSDDVVNRHAASGTVAEVTDALARYRRVGLDEIVLTGLSDPQILHRLLNATRSAG
ncbi:MAG TPA: LLM class flavin-dependent oxidoreductase [Stellaceae bacterium]|nr:LLM class flavin-dependent oxidoreductase [Stellaceae bacterium]